MINFTTGIPAQNNNPSKDQPDMLQNNDNIPVFVGIDHYGFNVSTNNSGTHKKVTLSNLAMGPGFTGGDGVLYAGLFNGDSWPVWQNTTGSTILASSATNASANGYASLPGGLLVQWGQSAGSGLSSVPVSFNTNFTSAGVNTPAYSVVVTASRAASSPGNSDSYIVQGSISASGFTIFNNGSHTFTGWYWIAIGPKN